MIFLVSTLARWLYLSVLVTRREERLKKKEEEGKNAIMNEKH